MSVKYNIEPSYDTATARNCRLKYPGYSWCLRCGFPWAVVRGHATDVWREGYFSGMFPLCEDCWAALGTVEKRAPYYGRLLQHWAEGGSTIDMEFIEAVALALEKEAT